MDDLIIASRLVHFAALALLFGGSLFRLLIRPRNPNQRQPWPRAIDITVVVAALLSALGVVHRHWSEHDWGLVQERA